MTKYTPTNWQDALFDEEGNRVQKGTALSADNLNKIEQGVATVDGKVEAAQTAISGLPKRSEFVAVTQQLADTANEIKQLGYNVMWNSLLALDGDWTNAIQTAIDTHTNVFVPDGEFLVDALKSLKLKSGTKLVLSKKTVLKAKPNNSAHSAIIKVIDVTGVSITGGKLVGDKKEHLGTTGEWGMGIDMRGSTDVYVADIEINDCWGDGVYIGTTVTQNYCKDVLIERFKMDNNRRQGISLISAKNLTIRNGYISNTSGVQPMDGMDIEPNYNHEFLEDIKIIDVTTENNGGSGIKFFMANLDETSAPVSITVVRHNDRTVTSGDASFRIRKIRKGTRGFIKAIDCVWDCVNNAMVFSHEECSSSGISVLSEDCTFHYGDKSVIGVIISHGGRGNLQAPNPEDVVASTVGNISFVRPKVYSKTGNLAVVFRAEGFNGFPHDKFSLIDPVVVDALDHAQLGRSILSTSETTRLRLSDANQLLVNVKTLSEVAANVVRVQSVLENLSTATGNGVSLSAYSNKVGLEFTVKIAASDGVINPGASSTIRGFALGQSIKPETASPYSATKFRVRAVGVFEILSTTARWIAV